MAQAKWRFKINKDGTVEVEGFNFEGSQCVDDAIYKLLKQTAIIEKETKHKTFGDTRPVDNVYYIER